MKENQEKNKGTHILILVICIAVYIVFMLLTGPIQIPQLSLFNGVFAQINVLMAIIMVVSNRKRGFISAVSLNAISCVLTLMRYLQEVESRALPGVFVPIVSIVSLSIIYGNLYQNQAMQEELNEQYEKIMDSNRIMQEKDDALKMLAYSDRLTGMQNMQYFREQMEEAVKLEMPFTMIYIDIDNFKGINDTFGPKTGDTALIAYAERLSSYCGRKYICARTNGDEFGVILTGEQTEADVLNIIEQLRRLFGEQITVQGAKLSVTASYGIVSHPRDGRNDETLLDSAIMAVYNAKANGKDRACFFSQG
ncbi:MAG: GGDEF domain-containing protein [Ruminococcus sp.]|nr:GGDEF domain-containing protein [Ruminococcus sp.]